MDSDFQFWFNVGMTLGAPDIMLFAKKYSERRITRNTTSSITD